MTVHYYSNQLKNCWNIMSYMYIYIILYVYFCSYTKLRETKGKWLRNIQEKLEEAGKTQKYEIFRNICKISKERCQQSNYYIVSNYYIIDNDESNHYITDNDILSLMIHDSQWYFIFYESL